MGIGVTVARLTLNQLVKVRILDPQLKGPPGGDPPGGPVFHIRVFCVQFAMAALFCFFS